MKKYKRSQINIIYNDYDFISSYFLFWYIAWDYLLKIFLNILSYPIHRYCKDNFSQWISYHYFWRIERQWYSLYLLLLRRNLCKETLKEMKHWLNDNPLSIAAVITCQITFVLSHCCVDLWKFMQEVNLNICYFKIDLKNVFLFFLCFSLLIIYIILESFQLSDKT